MKYIFIALILFLCSFSLDAQQVYTCLFTDTGTEQPDVIILKNTLTDTVHWEMIADGCYKGSINGGFDKNRTTVTTGAYLGTEDDVDIFQNAGVGGGFIYLCSLKNGNSYGGGFIFGFPFEIRIYQTD